MDNEHKSEPVAESPALKGIIASMGQVAYTSSELYSAWAFSAAITDNTFLAPLALPKVLSQLYKDQFNRDEPSYIADHKLGKIGGSDIRTRYSEKMEEGVSGDALEEYRQELTRQCNAQFRTGIRKRLDVSERDLPDEKFDECYNRMCEPTDVAKANIKQVLTFAYDHSDIDIVVATYGNGIQDAYNKTLLTQLSREMGKGGVLPSNMTCVLSSEEGIANQTELAKIGVERAKEKRGESKTGVAAGHPVVCSLHGAIKPDGAEVFATRDVAAALDRYETSRTFKEPSFAENITAFGRRMTGWRDSMCGVASQDAHQHSLKK